MTDFITVTYQERTIEKHKEEITFCDEQPEPTITPRKAIIRKDSITRILETAQGSIVFMNDGAVLAVVNTVEEIKEKFYNDIKYEFLKDVPFGMNYYKGEEGSDGVFEGIETLKRELEALYSCTPEDITFMLCKAIKVDGYKVGVTQVHIKDRQVGILYRK